MLLADSLELLFAGRSLHHFVDLHKSLGESLLKISRQKRRVIGETFGEVDGGKFSTFRT